MNLKKAHKLFGTASKHEITLNLFILSIMLSQTSKKVCKLIVLLLLIKNTNLQASKNNKSGIEKKLAGATVVAATYASNTASQIRHNHLEDTKEMDSEAVDLLYRYKIRKILDEIKEDQATICSKLNRSKNFHKRLVLMGEKSVGKTNLANYLCNTSLEVQGNEEDTEQSLISVAGSISMKSKHENYGIRFTTKSATTIPNFFPFKAYNNSSDVEIPLSVIDCPGTIREGDTRGKEQTIKHAFYLQTIFNGLGTISSGIQDFTIALVVKHQELTGRALGLRRALSSMAQLTDNNKSVADHTIFIVTQGHEKNTSADVACLLEKAKSTLRLDGSQVGINAAKMREIYWSEHLLDTLIASQKNKIFIFPSPAKPGNFKSDTRKKVLLALETIPPLKKLEVKTVVPYEIKSDMQAMANRLRFQIVETETDMVEYIQNKFNIQLDFTNDFDSSFKQLSEKYLNATKMLKNLQKIINTNITKGFINIDHDWLIKEELSLLPFILKDFIKCKENEDTIQDITTDLFQLQSCASICNEAFRDSVSYDKLLRSIDNFNKVIKKKTEKELLSYAHRFKLINQEFQLVLEALVKTIIKNIEEGEPTELEASKNLYMDFLHFSIITSMVPPSDQVWKLSSIDSNENEEVIDKLEKAKTSTKKPLYTFNKSIELSEVYLSLSDDEKIIFDKSNEVIQNALQLWSQSGHHAYNLLNKGILTPLSNFNKRYAITNFSENFDACSIRAVNSGKVFNFYNVSCKHAEKILKLHGPFLTTIQNFKKNLNILWLTSPVYDGLGDMGITVHMLKSLKAKMPNHHHQVIGIFNHSTSDILSDDKESIERRDKMIHMLESTCIDHNIPFQILKNVHNIKSKDVQSFATGERAVDVIFKMTTASMKLKYTPEKGTYFPPCIKVLEGGNHYTHKRDDDAKELILAVGFSKEKSGLLWKNFNYTENDIKGTLEKIAESFAESMLKMGRKLVHYGGIKKRLLAGDYYICYYRAVLERRFYSFILTTLTALKEKEPANFDRRPVLFIALGKDLNTFIKDPYLKELITYGSKKDLVRALKIYNGLEPNSMEEIPFDSNSKGCYLYIIATGLLDSATYEKLVIASNHWTLVRGFASITSALDAGKVVSLSIPSYLGEYVKEIADLTLGYTQKEAVYEKIEKLCTVNDFSIEESIAIMLPLARIACNPKDYQAYLKRLENAKKKHLVDSFEAYVHNGLQVPIVHKLSPNKPCDKKKSTECFLL